MAPTLFKIFISKALHKWQQKSSGIGIQINNDVLYSLNFADDQVLSTGDQDDASHMLRKLNGAYIKKMGT